MLSAQYIIRLPSDYDMEIIRERVASNGSRFDGFPGLFMKAWLASERQAGAPENRYAPFYLWRDPAALGGFICGEGFAGLEGSFGRPRIDTGVVVAAANAVDESGSRAGSASVERQLVAPGTALAALQEAEQAHAEITASAGALAAISTLDLADWKLGRFTIWPSNTPIVEQDRGAESAERYELLHISLGDDVAPVATGQALRGES